MLRKWTAEEEIYLVKNYTKSLDELANYLNRTKKSIKRKLYTLKLSRARPWTDKESEFLVENYHKGHKYCAEKLERSAPTILKYARLLGVYEEQYKQWSEEDILILKSVYPLEGIEGCAKLINKPKSNIYRQASRLKLTAPPRKKYSIMALEWLASFNSPNILHAENGGEKAIGPYYVDGFDATTNTVYEFHGDCFHGNLDIFDPDDFCNPFDKRKTADQLWQRTFDKMQYISKRGYTVLFIWENDYKNGKTYEQF